MCYIYKTLYAYLELTEHSITYTLFISITFALCLVLSAKLPMLYTASSALCVCLFLVLCLSYILARSVSILYFLRVIHQLNHVYNALLFLFVYRCLILPCGIIDWCLVWHVFIVELISQITSLYNVCEVEK